MTKWYVIHRRIQARSYEVEAKSLNNAFTILDDYLDGSYHDIRVLPQEEWVLPLIYSEAFEGWERIDEG